MNLGVVGLDLATAKRILADNGITIGKITVTNPPKETSQSYDDTYRVIRIDKVVGHAIEILISKPLF